MTAIHTRGLQIPQDISIAGYDGITIDQLLDPKLTTLVQDTEMLGQLAAEKLIGLINEPKTALIERFMIEGHISKGGSVAKI